MIWWWWCIVGLYTNSTCKLEAWKHGQARHSRWQSTCLRWWSSPTCIHLDPRSFSTTISTARTSAVLSISSLTVSSTSWAASYTLHSSGCMLLGPTTAAYPAAAAASTTGNNMSNVRLIAWHSGRTSDSGRRTFPILRSTCSWWVTTIVGKPSSTGQATRPTQPFILSGSINE